MHALIRDQLRGLSAPAFEVLAAAAVLGTEATFERLCLVAELDERAGLAALDELGRRGLLVETAMHETGGDRAGRWPGALRTSRCARWSTPRPGRPGAGCSTGGPSPCSSAGGAPAATLAHHAQAAGLTEPALRALVAAGDAALAVFAARDAQAHYEQARRLLAGPDATAPPRRHDWGEAPAVAVLHGRAEELATLAGWLREEHCRVVQVLGAGGIGKTALAARLAHDLAPEFEVRVLAQPAQRPARRRSGWPGPSPPSPPARSPCPPRAGGAAAAAAGPAAGAARAAGAGQPGDGAGAGHATVRYRAGYEGYGEVLRQLGESAHQGCLLLTSREQPLRGGRAGGARAAPGGAAGGGRPGAAGAAGAGGRRGGLARAGGALRRQPAGAAGGGRDHRDGLRRGHRRLPGAGGERCSASIRQLLDEQVARLSALERAVLTWLAVEREPVGFAELVADLGPGVGAGAVVEAVEALRRRSLLEAGGRGTFTLQPVVLEYATARLVERVAQEILAGEPALLVSHALVKAHGARTTCGAARSA